MKLPIIRQLKKKDQIEIAGVQDQLMHLLYNVRNSLIIHGGITIKEFYSDLPSTYNKMVNYLNSI
jgi:hypothetical protein